VCRSPGHGPATTSSMAAVSRTVRVTARLDTIPPQASARSGQSGTRPREGFRPTRPHSLAGMRIDPPPSEALASGTRPAATAAADPPLDPPLERSVSHGLWHGPYASDSAVGSRPSSEVLVLPSQTSPAARNRLVSSASWSAVQPAWRAGLRPAW
jgi:hypothetical protein